ncbi:MAG: enoyl-CoA hydratase/isomerase family protein [Desulfobacteraceae bacterium]|jgi:enoyl-CoA hydratase|nr:enoyl-CoA hydratase/isomerase family protein [Desulfobacteraceae bacterium]
MNFKCILFEKEAPIAFIKLNRPQVLNAMNKIMWLEIQTAMVDVIADDTIRVLVFTGEGRAFSTGADLKESKTRTPEAYRDYLEYLQSVSLEIIRFEKPTIAAVNGYALGSGYELALACDIRIAAEDAPIGSPEARVSSSATGGAFRLLHDLIGPAKARELLFTAENIDGRTAEKIGLVNKAVPKDRLMDVACAMAAKIAENSAFSIKVLKQGLNMAANGKDMEALMNFEVEACLACVSSKERLSALSNFESRKKS